MEHCFTWGVLKNLLVCLAIWAVAQKDLETCALDKILHCNSYIYNNFFVCLFVNHMKTTECINMGLQPYDVKSSVDGH